jgi:transposase InsO family protein/transposase-like protein
VDTLNPGFGRGKREDPLMARKNYSEEFRRDAVELYRATEGATITQIAVDLAITDATLSAWIKAAGVPVRGRHGAAGSTSEADTSDELARLRAQVAELEASERTLATERDILRGGEVFRRGDELVTRFQFVADHRDTFEVKRLCQIVQVSRSSYYAWADSADARAQRAADDEALAGRIRAVHEADNTYGAPRITAELNDGTILGDDGRVNHKRVARVMRERGIAGLRLRRKIRTTIPEPADTPVPDLLKRDFTANEPNTKYVGDITYLPYEGGHLYLATVIDLYSRRLVGWSIADHMRTELVCDALRAAQRERGTLAGAIFHGDHGAQYTSQDYAKLCADLGVTRSMGAVGSSADNVLAELFNATLQRETLQSAARWDTARHARLAVFRWITRYSTRRRHSACGHLSPITYENTTSAATLRPAA